MDTSSVAGMSTAMSNAKLQQSQQVAVEKKAIDIAKSGALQLINSIPPAPTVSSTGGIAGQTISVKA